ncbi:MAG: hypothetical protein NT166_02510 [Candidatus Aminicenantes bacterium]|nr:hypothetical protein [Candidatus Aminicenantes bacterium]
MIWMVETLIEKKIENVSPPLSPDFKELFEHMDRIPLLRHEILVQFRQFKEEHQALVKKAMKSNPGEMV